MRDHGTPARALRGRALARGAAILLPLLLLGAGRREPPRPARPGEIRLALEADGYADWMPEPGPDERTPGRRLTVHARFLAPPGAPLPATVELQLVDVSNEPGVALDDAFDPNRTPLPDFAFAPGDNPDSVRQGDGMKLVVPVRDGTATATVASYDGGAWADLTARALLPDGRVVDGDALPLPARLPGTHIAAAFLRTFYDGGSGGGAGGGDGEDGNPKCKGDDNGDHDQQKDNPETGDGFTCFEEYRGAKSVVSVNGQLKRPIRFRRFNPARKTLVVENDAGPTARPGLKIFADAARVEVIEVEYLGPDRVANAASNKFHRGNQHGILISKYVPPPPPPPAPGKPPPPPSSVIICGDDPPHDGARCTEVKVAACPVKGDNTVAHGIGHCLGLLHHGDGNIAETGGILARLGAEVRSGSVTVTIYNSAGLAITDGLGAVVGGIGVEQGESSGDVNCVMTYNHDANWAMHRTGFGHVDLYAIDHVAADGASFCTEGAGTGYNSPTHRVGGHTVSYFGDARAGRGECLKRMRFKDW